MKVTINMVVTHDGEAGNIAKHEISDTVKSSVALHFEEVIDMTPKVEVLITSFEYKDNTEGLRAEAMRLLSGMSPEELEEFVKERA